MHRQEITWSTPPTEIRLRGCTSSVEREPRAASQPVAASFPNADGQSVPVAATPPPDLSPLLESIGTTLGAIDQRRQQSLGELQQVAIELAIAVASHLVFESISQEQHGVQELVRQAVDAMGINAAPVVFLHPRDCELLQKRFATDPPPWTDEQVTLRADNSIARGGCRVEASDGRMQISDISLRLSEIRRHWMEELDDSQVERRSTAGEGQSLRRFPDRREIA